jgi:hypothetical protein
MHGWIGCLFYLLKNAVKTIIIPASMLGQSRSYCHRPIYRNHKTLALFSRGVLQHLVRFSLPWISRLGSLHHNSTCFSRFMTFGAICLEHKLGGSVVEPIVRRYSYKSELVAGLPFYFCFSSLSYSIFFPY